MPQIFINKEQAVQQISNPSVRGITTGKTKSFGSIVYVEIEIGINVRKFVPQDNDADSDKSQRNRRFIKQSSIWENRGFGANPDFS